MTYLLDEWAPIIAGSEINDDPLSPISNESKELISKYGDKTLLNGSTGMIFFEKLATPDVTVADLIGDVDPIKATT